jgi:predicted HTH transcriptional regulator
LATVASAMTLGSFSSGALYEVSVADVNRMLSLDETLFVEHKAGMGDKESFKVLQAIAAFANTAGGWLLVGVHGGKIIR